MADVPPSTDAKRVMIVDDDDDLRETISDVLTSHGYVVSEAGDGATAMAVLQKSASLPQLILLDLVLPDCDGFEFRTRQLAERSLAAIPVVVLSGSGDIAAISAVLRVKGYLQKPFEPRTLLAAVERHWPSTG